MFNLNVWLGAISILTTVSGFGFKGSETTIWLHIVIGLIWTTTAYIHLRIHFDSSKSLLRNILNIKTKITKGMVIFSILAIATGVIATLVMVAIDVEYNYVGIAHGKLGLLLTLYMLLHTFKRYKWFKGRPNGNEFQLAIDKNICVDCGICVKGCPCRVLSKGKEGIEIVNVDFCVACRKCIYLCPVKAISARDK